MKLKRNAKIKTQRGKVPWMLYQMNRIIPKLNLKRQDTFQVSKKKKRNNTKRAMKITS